MQYARSQETEEEIYCLAFKVSSEHKTDMHLETPLGPERQGAKITPRAPVRIFKRSVRTETCSF